MNLPDRITHPYGPLSRGDAMALDSLDYLD